MIFSMISPYHTRHNVKVLTVFFTGFTSLSPSLFICFRPIRFSPSFSPLCHGGKLFLTSRTVFMCFYVLLTRLLQRVFDKKEVLTSEYMKICILVAEVLCYPISERLCNRSFGSGHLVYILYATAAVGW